MAGWNPASPAWAGAAALREGRGPAQAKQGLPTRLLFLFDPFKNYSLQIPGQLGEEKLVGRRTEKAAAAQRWDSGTPRAEVGPAAATGPRRAPVASPGSVSLRPEIWEHRPHRPPRTPSLRRAGDGRPLSGHSAPRPQPSAWPRARSCTAKSPRAGTACSARAQSSMGRRWTCSCPWAFPAPARKSPAWAPRPSTSLRLAILALPETCLGEHDGRAGGGSVGLGDCLGMLDGRGIRFESRVSLVALGGSRALPQRSLILSPGEAGPLEDLDPLSIQSGELFGSGG